MTRPSTLNSGKPAEIGQSEGAGPGAALLASAVPAESALASGDDAALPVKRRHDD